MGARLGREARLIGEASIEGRLYSLGRYPGLVEAADRESRVHGEVFALNSPAASLAWLDAYERISSQQCPQRLRTLRAQGAAYVSARN